ncbi:MAG: alpha/beta fold hydrolase [Mycobacterium sp.]
MRRSRRIGAAHARRCRALAINAATWDPAWFDAFSAYTLARARESHVKATMRRLLSTLTKEIPADETARIGVPTALLWGREDRMIPLRFAERAAARRDWPLFIVERAAHVPHIEQPEPFVRTLRAACAAPDS